MLFMNCAANSHILTHESILRTEYTKETKKLNGSIFYDKQYKLVNLFVRWHKAIVVETSVSLENNTFLLKLCVSTVEVESLPERSI